jgi:molybdopterin/thiamine biosynthesis adenylyltransferase
VTRQNALFVPHQVLAEIRTTLRVSGSLGLRRHGDDDAFTVTKWTSTFTSDVQFRQPLTLLTTDDDRYVATWHRTSVGAHYTHWQLSRRTATAISVDAFRTLVPTFTAIGGKHNVVLTHAPGIADLDDEHPLAEFAGWLVTDDEAYPFPVHLEPEHYGIEQLAATWPVATLQQRRILIVGCGSLGGVAAEALAAYGIGSLGLLDPDRFLWHNTVRHVLGSEHVGRYKVDALETHIGSRWPRTAVTPLPWDVVTDAHHVRELFGEIDLVICAADGIAARRVTSHLAARAATVAIFTSVLEDGAYGEVLRQRPRTDHGCLLCRRATSYETGEMDPERVLERGYGDGNPHRAMTAVGPDLALVGHLAAKVAVSTLLERAGHAEARLPGEQAVISLRPIPGMAAPFDASRTPEIRWLPAGPPRPDCVTCQPA